MKQSVIPLVITGVLAIAAGVAIAGLPSDPPGSQIVITELPTTTTTTLVIVPDTVSPLPTTAPTSSLGVSTTTTVAAPADSTTPTTTTTEPPPDSRPLVDRAELFVGTANAAGISGIASSTADALRAIGYANVQPLDAQNPASDSVVYHAPDFAAEATRLAADLGWPISQIAPIEGLPPLTGSAAFDLVALIGVDQTGPADDL